MISKSSFRENGDQTTKAKAHTAGPLENQRILQHFLAHQRAWSVGLLFCWAGINVVVLASSVILEDRRSAASFAVWEPFCWEITSAVMLLLLLPLVLAISDRYLQNLPWPKQLLAHGLITLPFSMLHVAGMVYLRKFCYWFAASEYSFGNVGYEFLYEYRKDLQTYLIMAVVVTSYRFIVRRLHGEASVLCEPETQETNQHKPLSRLLVRKLGKEFLIKVQDIEWIEAAGNYANLHIGERVYPIRITMGKLENMLPNELFARIHRSTIINLNALDTLTPLDTGDYEVTLKNAKRLSLSRRYRETFKALVS